MQLLSSRTRTTTARAIPWLLLASALFFLNRDQKPVPAAAPVKPDPSNPATFEVAEPGRGRTATRPQAIPRRGWKDIAWRTWKEIGKDRLSIVAGGVTFYTLLAIFPTLSAFVSLYGLIADVEAVRTQIVQLSRILPPGGVEIISEQMLRVATADESGLSAAFAFSLLLAIWSANAGMNALFDGMNIAYGEAEKRGFIKRRLVTLGFTIGAILLLTTVSFVLIALPVWLNATFGMGPADLWWVPFSWLAVLALVISAFAAVYRFGPSRSVATWHWVWIGAIFAAITWIVGSVGFSIYLSRFANYDDAYGPLGTVIGFMVWLWFSSMVVLLGAELNAEIEHQTAVDTTTGPQAPMGERGAEVADTLGAALTKRNVAREKRKEHTIWRKLRRAPPPGPTDAPPS